MVEKYNGYVTSEFDWQYTAAFGGPRPIAEVISHGDMDVSPAHIFYPEAVGGIYNVPTIAAAQENTNAIQRCLDRMPDSGGVIAIRDEFYTYGTIRNPKRLYDGVERWIPFGILGMSPGRSAIINVEPGEVAIELDLSTYAYMFPSGAPPVTLRDLIVISQGPGIKCLNIGASMLQSLNVLVCHCKGYGWMFDQCYGFMLNNARALFNSEEGFKFVDSVMWESVLTAMWNANEGITALRSHLIGNIHCEGNEQYSTDIDGSSGDFKLWQEGNWRGTVDMSSRIQGKIRNCNENLRIRPGSLQSGTGLDFDMDDISSRSVVLDRIETDPVRNIVLAPSEITLAPLADSFLILPWWDAGYAPTLQGTTLISPIGSYGHVQAFARGASWIYINFTEVNTIIFAVGDRLEVQLDIDMNAPMAQWFKDNNQPLVGALFNGPLAGLTVTWYVRHTGAKRWRIATNATSSGSGAAFAIQLPWSANPAVAPDEHRMTITNLKVYHMRSGM